MSLPPFCNALLALGIGAGALAGVSRLSVTATEGALAWTTEDRSGAGIAPLTMRGVEATFASVERVALRAEVLRLAPTRLGPFAVNPSRSIELEDVELRIGRDAADGAVIRARRGRLERDGVELRDRVLARRDDRGRRGGRVLHAERVVWRRGEERLRFESPRAITDFGLEPVSP